MDLATAEEHLPQSINPLSLHIMRLTSEYTGNFPRAGHMEIMHLGTQNNT
jgi:hypothetical protein